MFIGSFAVVAVVVVCAAGAVYARVSPPTPRGPFVRNRSISACPCSLMVTKAAVQVRVGVWAVFVVASTLISVEDRAVGRLSSLLVPGHFSITAVTAVTAVTEVTAAIAATADTAAAVAVLDTAGSSAIVAGSYN